ncbi:sulfotransferase family protein [Pseudoalteromonas sp. NJ631]|uniref:sulfotransferase family protein n=1 Tax=Pseudoalteromonas sp. NJ631 TaxID=493915 RepID=UPI0002E3A7C2|nr:sulfotransferase family protein [Pseudoalteromonas sp. NJ631]
MTKHKFLVTGLPRTGTTSLCIAALGAGYKTAHTAYTRQALDCAEFIADTPVFADYEKLYALYPEAKIIQLTREFEQWLPSIKRLMTAMKENLLSQRGGFNDTIKRCYLETFPDFDKHFEDDVYWQDCYYKHHDRVLRFAKMNDIPFITVNLTAADAEQTLAEFIGVTQEKVTIPHVNIGGKVTAWKWFSHSNKVESTRNGKADKDTALFSMQVRSSA